MSDTDLELVQLAALLHDIGKFWQRTGAVHRPLESEFDAADVGAHGAHARWSAAFILEHVPERWRRCGWAALTHHRPLSGNRPAQIVALADRLAAAERRPLEEEGAAEGPRQVRSVLADVRLVQANGSAAGAGRSEGYYLPLRPLAYDEETLFPRPTVLVGTEQRAAYTRLWDAFIEEHACLPRGSFRAYFDSLYHLLFKYTWCVPSAYYRDEPDVSLFDHARVTCTLATCLWLDAISDSDLQTLLGPAQARDAALVESPRLLLVGGDVSGVQRFLYTISSQGALRGLRGRSFYLQLLAHAIARSLLRRWRLPLTNLLIEGGGHFWLLAPYTVRDDLRAASKELTEILLEEHRGQLFVALAGQPLAVADLQAVDRLSDAWQALNEALGRAKRRKGEDLAHAQLAERLFSAQGAGGDEQGICRICREEGPFASEEEAADDDGRTCLLCRRLERMGADLRRARALLLWEARPLDSPPGPGGAATNNAEGDMLARLGMGVKVVRERQSMHAALEEEKAPADAPLTALRLEDTDLAAMAHEAGRLGRSDVAVGFQLLAQATPEVVRGEGRVVADFADLAEASTGIHRLGFLRADVDNLGALFGSGLDTSGKARDKPPATLSRRATLSLSLRLFFEGWLSRACGAYNPLAERDSDGRDQLYLIYGGGDDLFLVGAWSAVAEVAPHIAAKYQAYAGGNPDVHLSAGIAVHPRKFPLYQAAEDAGRALEAAKAHPGKDAISFLDRTLGWAAFGQVQRLALQLAGDATVGEHGDPTGVAGRDAPRSMLHLAGRLYGSATVEQRRRRLRMDQVPWGRWMWLGAYQLSRLAQRRPELRPLVEEIQRRLMEPAGLVELTVAARWAELRVRKETE